MAENKGTLQKLQHKFKDKLTHRSKDEAAELDADADSVGVSGSRRVKLEPVFDSSLLTTDRLKDVADRLQEATEQLEYELQKAAEPSSSHKLPNVADKVKRSEDDEVGISANDISTELQGDKKVQEQKSSSKVGEFLAKLYPVTNLIVGIAGTAAGAAGPPGASAATSGLSQALELLMKPKEQSEVVTQALDSVANDNIFIEKLRELPPTTHDEGLLHSAVEFQVALIDFVRYGIRWLEKPYLRKVGDSIIDKKEVQDAANALETHRNKLKSAVSEETHFVVKWREIRTRHAEILRNVCSDESLAKQVERQQSLHRDRLPNTGLWISDVENVNFQQWRRGEVAVLWCPGRPGAGKTFMSSKLVDVLGTYVRHQKDAALAYVYFRIEDMSDQSDYALCGWLIRQLLGQHMSSTLQFQDELKNKSYSLEDRISLLQDIISLFKVVFVVIDGLDVFSGKHNDRIKLVETLLNVSHKLESGRLRLCITSRPFEDVWQLIEKRSAKRMEVRVPAVDIEIMIERAIDQDEHALTLLRGDPRLRDLLKTEIVKRSSCIFRLAGLQLAKALRQPTAINVADSLDGLSAEIDDYHRETMTRIEQKPKEERDMIHRLFAWVLAAHKPMSIADLEFPAGMADGAITERCLQYGAVLDLEHYVSLSEGLLIQERAVSSVVWRMSGERDMQRQMTLHFAHDTVRDFLVKNNCYLPEHHDTVVVRSCLRFLSCDTIVRAIPKIAQERTMLVTQIRFDRSTCRRGIVEAIEDPNKEAASLDAAGSFLLWAHENWPYYLSSSEYRERLAGTSQGPGSNGPREPSQEDLELLNSLAKKHDGAGFTPLHWCAMYDWPNLAKWFIDKVDPNAYDQEGMTALYVAMVNYSYRTATVLVRNESVKVNLAKNRKIDGYMQSPFPTFLSRRAPDSRNWQIPEFDLALMQRADFEIISQCELLAWSDGQSLGDPMIMNTARKGPRVLRLLLARNGVEVNDTDVDGGTALISLIRDLTRSLEPNVRVLLACPGIDVNHINDEGNAALHYAATCRHGTGIEEVVRHQKVLWMLCSEPSLNKDVKDSKGRTALCIAASASVLVVLHAQWGRHFRHKIDRHFRDEAHNHFKHKTRLIDSLLNSGADCDLEDKEGYTPLDHYMTNAIELMENMKQGNAEQPGPALGLARMSKIRELAQRTVEKLRAASRNEERRPKDRPIWREYERSLGVHLGPQPLRRRLT